MSEINVNILVANVLNGMTCVLNDDQLNKLKDQLYIHLHDVEITNKKYELSESINENDIMKINYFEASMKISKYSDGTIKQYIRTAKLLRNFVGKNFADIDVRLMQRISFSVSVVSQKFVFKAACRFVTCYYFVENR